VERGRKKEGRKKMEKEGEKRKTRGEKYKSKNIGSWAATPKKVKRP